MTKITIQVWRRGVPASKEIPIIKSRLGWALHKTNLPTGEKRKKPVTYAVTAISCGMCVIPGLSMDMASELMDRMCKELPNPPTDIKEKWEQTKALRIWRDTMRWRDEDAEEPIPPLPRGQLVRRKSATTEKRHRGNK